MDRLQKRCLLASISTHALLLLLLVTGAAFFVPSSKHALETIPHLRAIPTRLIDGIGGGGGNPKLKPSDARIKGNTLTPQPPKPQPEPERETQKAPAQAATKPKKNANTRERAAERVKIPKNLDSISDKNTPLELRPSVRSNAAREKARQEAEAHEQAEAGARLAGKISSMEQQLTAGFKDGTAIEIDGPGGEATADYGAYVLTVYDENWTIPPSLTDEEATTKVSVTIARDGRVIDSRIVRRSGNSTLDRSVERTLEKVKFIHEFPEGSRDQERTYIFSFSLRLKHLLGLG
jgi:periplasmic protein TonB